MKKISKDRNCESSSVQHEYQPFWHIVGCSVPGTSHVQSGEQCHDSFAYNILSDGTLVIALSDGAGSIKNPKRGSEFIVKNITYYICAKLKNDGEPFFKRSWEKLLRAAFYETRNN